MENVSFQDVYIFNNPIYGPSIQIVNNIRTNKDIVLLLAALKRWRLVRSSTLLLRPVRFPNLYLSRSF